MLESGVYFITGIDTDAGKSYVTGYLAREIAALPGRRIITQKFVQTGCQGVSEDIITHRRLMGIDLLPEDLDYTTCAQVFSYPCSPDLAARIDGRVLDLHAITEATAVLSSRYDTVLVEGAGGLMVPLADDYLTADYVVEHDLPVVLVSSARLGSINHTLLTLEVCRSRGIRVAAVAYNGYPGGGEDGVIEAATRAYLQGYIARYHADAAWIEVPVID